MEMTNDRTAAERALAQASFAVFDTHLFLDTHPESAEALAYFYKKKEACDAVRAQYVKRFGPVTAGEDQSQTKWAWIDEPWPWQEED